MEIDIANRVADISQKLHEKHWILYQIRYLLDTYYYIICIMLFIEHAGSITILKSHHYCIVYIY